jgi:hypothetical protein
MPTIEFKFTLSEQSLTRTIEGLSYQNGYEDEILAPDPEDETGLILIPNPETKPKYAKRMIKKYILNCVKAWEATDAAESARLAAIEDVNENVELT